MSYLLPHLHSGWAVDQAILAEEERLVMIRFGHDWDETCMQVRTAFETLAFFSLLDLDSRGSVARGREFLLLVDGSRNPLLWVGGWGFEHWICIRNWEGIC